MTDTDKQNVPQDSVIQVNKSQLPLSCPLPDGQVWNLHPRVYLPIEKTGQASCPYCGAQYKLAAS
ncbi:zinc-finger domain-containing protein [Pleionea mediterranea]|jgi:uncharacterized Zn-finger protein|uniref:Putative Zn-finger protein n=1 Tax=Pleionea mediterranea TaxID=523701 RepID=A0A316FZN0_9GAMM|nr:zinc-finger domain-containing protein [Pleionea mediterranea]PWK53998.1 putative Zn-finger protein [Pleionea mediterranea]